MKLKDLFCKIIDLFLTSEESSADWVKVPSLRNSCIFIAVSGLVMFFLQYILFNFVVNANANVVFIFRTCLVVGWMVIASGLFILTFHYFRYVLIKNHPIRLSNVIFFYFIHLLIFGQIYSCIYFLFPDFYIYQNTPFKPSQHIVISLNASLVRLDFIIFSAFQSLNGTFYRISSNSVIPSILSWIQSLYSLAIIALLIASYVNQKVHPITKGHNDCSDARKNSAAD